LYAWALRWLDAGRLLVPLQPGSKRIVRGYGPVVRVVTDLEETKYWWELRRANIGLVTGYGISVLDFDDVVSWRGFCSQFPGVAGSFTVRTKRGAHVYLAGQVTVAVPGAEVKYNGGIVVTCVSVVAGHTYRPVNSDAKILQAPADLSLPSESPAAHRAASLTQLRTATLNDRISPQATWLTSAQLKPTMGTPAPIVKPDVARAGGDTVSRIKQALPLLDYAETLTKLTTRDGHFYHGLCPVHDETRPSFYVDVQRGLFGCYGCGKRGDVINLFAQVNHVRLAEAISRLAREVLR
jgi:hypothetical protein